MTNFDLAPHKVLIADDESFSRKILTRLLQDLGCTDIETANDGAQALDILSASKTIDIVISDFNMPVINGLELLKAVRSGAAGVPREMQFALLTGFSDKYLVDMALALDVGAFLIKPVSKKALSERLKKMLLHDDGGPRVQAANIYGTTFIEQADDAYETAREKRDALDKLYKSMGQEFPAEPAARPAGPAKTKRTASAKQRKPALTGKSSESDSAGKLAGGIVATDTGGGEGTASRLVDAPGPPQPAKPAAKASPAPSADENEGVHFFPLGAVPPSARLARDLYTADGSFFMIGGISLTPQIITSLLHLQETGMLALETVGDEVGIYASVDSPGTAAPRAGPPSKAEAERNTIEIYQVQPGAVLSHDLYTVNDGLYLEAGHVLTPGNISMLENLKELGLLQSPVRIRLGSQG